MTTEQVLATIQTGSNEAIENGSSEDGWVWTSEIGLFPLKAYSGKLRILANKGLIEISGRDAEVRSGWGRMVRTAEVTR